MCRRTASLAAVLLLVSGAAVAVTAASRVYRSAEWGFEFSYPDTLVVGRYKDQMTPEQEAAPLRETGLENPFKHAIPLVEPGRLGTRGTLQAIPVGEVATVTVTPTRGHKADFLRRQFFRKDWELTVAGRTVYKLPGYPGPYGDAAFYYLLSARDDLVIELFAHKKHLDPARTDTGYDRVIEGIIASFKIVPPGG